jgi:hypothetical protein
MNGEKTKKVRDAIEKTEAIEMGGNAYAGGERLTLVDYLETGKGYLVRISGQIS